MRTPSCSAIQGYGDGERHKDHRLTAETPPMPAKNISDITIKHDKFSLRLEAKPMKTKNTQCRLLLLLKNNP